MGRSFEDIMPTSYPRVISLVRFTPFANMEKAKQIQEQKVIDQELQSLKKGAKVYKQQQNSTIFFLSSREKELANCKKTMDNLMQEYKEAETG